MDKYDQRLESAERRAEKLQELQEREVAVKERAQLKHEQDVATWNERQRVQRHHEVLLKMLEIQGNAPRDSGSYDDDLHEARRIADLAYPPPAKETP